MKEKFIHKKRFVILIIIAVALIAVGAVVYFFLLQIPYAEIGSWLSTLKSQKLHLMK